MLADPDLVVAQVIEPLDQLHVAVDGQGRILAYSMERSEEDAEFHSAMGHGFSMRWVSRRGLAGERHFGHDEAVVGTWLEGDTPVHAVHDDLLEELDRGLFIVKDR